MLRRLRIAVALATVAALAGCPGDDGPLNDFRIQLALDTDELDATCDVDARCDDFALGCPIVVGIRLLDLPDPEDPSAPPKVRERLCRRTAEPAFDLCDLGDARVFEVNFSNIRPDRGQIELLVWRDVAEEPDCPEVQFTVAGRPIVDALDPNPPAFGRRIFYDFGGRNDVARIPLACSRPAVVDDAACTPPTTDLRVDVDDIDNLLLGVSGDKAPFLSVRVGQPTSSDGTNYEIVPEETYQLDRVQDIPELRPYWAAEDLPTSFATDSDICAIVTDFGSVPAVTCSTVQAPDSIELLSYMVAKEDWDSMRAAIELSTFPAEGLVLGRVVDTNMNPLDGVVVTPSELPDALWYLNDRKDSTTDDGGVPLSSTSASGYFVARGPSFASTWSATRAGGWEELGEPTGGSLRQSLTVLLIVMTQDLTP